eukprot:2755488-Pyramimonas_sp.AAC.1
MCISGLRAVGPLVEVDYEGDERVQDLRLLDDGLEAAALITVEQQISSHCVDDLIAGFASEVLDRKFVTRLRVGPHGGRAADQDKQAQHYSGQGRAGPRTTHHFKHTPHSFVCPATVLTAFLECLALQFGGWLSAPRCLR